MMHRYGFACARAVLFLLLRSSGQVPLSQAQSIILRSPSCIPTTFTPPMDRRRRLWRRRPAGDTGPDHHCRRGSCAVSGWQQDVFTGSVFHTFHQGHDSVVVMNQLGYDAMVLGSYEFTHGAQRLAQFVSALEFPALGHNMDFSRSPLLADKVMPYTIKPFDGEPVGIIGVTRGNIAHPPNPGTGVLTRPMRTWCRGS